MTGEQSLDENWQDVPLYARLRDRLACFCQARPRQTKESWQDAEMYPILPKTFPMKRSRI